MTPRPLRALAGAVLGAAVVGTLLTAVAGSPAQAASSRPEVGDCHSLTLAELNEVSDSDPRISCERAHTSRTVAVKDVEASAFRNDSTMARAGARVCDPAIDRAIGGTTASRHLVAYSGGYFFPTRAQLKAGARWIRCDIVLFGGRRLLALPTDREPAVGNGPYKSNVARCLQVGQSSLYVTACSIKHNYRSKGTVKVAGSAYPGDERLSRIAAQRCPGVARTRNYYASWPSELSWKIGKNRHVVCYASSRR